MAKKVSNKKPLFGNKRSHALNTTKMGTGITDKVENYLIEKGETFKYELTKENKEIFIDNQLDQQLENSKIPQVLRTYIKNVLVDKVEIEDGETIYNYHDFAFYCTKIIQKH